MNQLPRNKGAQKVFQDFSEWQNSTVLIIFEGAHIYRAMNFMRETYFCEVSIANNFQSTQQRKY